MKFIFFIISFFYLLNSLPSEDIWKQVINRKSNNTLINNNNYFIYQENDFCKKYSEDMKKLNEKQKFFFAKWETPNYIFVVNNFDENLESIEDGVFHLNQYLYKEFKVKMENSIITLISIKTRRIKIKMGEITKNIITDNNAENIIASLKDLFLQKDYYKTILKYYDNLDKYMGREKIYLEIDDRNSILTTILLIIAFASFIFLIVEIIITISKCRYLPNDANLKNIVSFLQLQKTNKNIFIENCIICLKNLEIVKIVNESNEGKEKIELTVKKNDTNRILIEKEDEGGNKPLIEKEGDYNKELIEKEENGISKLNCGHQFHTECIIRWLKIKNDCPICSQILLNEEDNNKIVWKTQIELYPKFKNIKYEHLYTKKFYVPSNGGGGVYYGGDIGGGHYVCGDIGGGHYGCGNFGGGDIGAGFGGGGDCGGCCGGGF